MHDFNHFESLNGDWSAKNFSFGGNTTGFSQASFGGNSTFDIIDEFRFLAARSIRTSTIILASFNTVSAAATAAGIFYDCYSRAKRNRPRSRRRAIIFTCVRGPELYPFILSLGIAIQGIVFAISQSFGLHGLFIAGCSLISQFMWPTIFIVPYIQVVFGLEVTFRALRKKPLPSRGKWDVVICLATIKILLLITGLVGFFISAPAFCFASLFWFVARWAEGGFVLLLLIAVVLAICATTLYLRLTRNSTIETTERVTASRMVYYLLIAVVSNAMMVPFFIYLTFYSGTDTNGNTGLTLSMIATVVANVTGLMTGGLYLFLRSNTISTIGPRDKLAEYERQRLKYQIRMPGPGDPDFDSHMLQPVPGAQTLQKTSSQQSLISNEKDIEADAPSWDQEDPNPLRSNAVFSPPAMPRAAELPMPRPSSTYDHSSRPPTSYTLFPNNNQNNASTISQLAANAYTTNAPVLLSSIYRTNDTGDVLRPPGAFRPAKRGHRRDSSMASSATVQIGLRLSNVEDMPPFANRAVQEAERASDLDCPNIPTTGASQRPSPLSTMERVASPPTSRVAASMISAMDNVSPVAPLSSGAAKEDCTLNPTVYDPNSPTKAKIPSPKGVGFNVPKRTNTTPVTGSPTTPQPHRRGNSSAATSGADWI
ncbi:hypothetical protein GGR56DRAFT_99796 [Xylariaceae sp. FL0804]|nr:hypothetical protein GGR56DRAFT_99796 [Xylariaceae sp. FL0804]